jgi:hypothetical protein
VLGVNTARSLTFKDGRVNKEQVAKIRATLDGLPPNVTRVVVTHHPFDLPQGAEERDLVDRAGMAMEVFAGRGIDLLMAGHLHMSHAGNTQARYKISEYAALVVQAGTATSTRGRGEVNSFNVHPHERTSASRWTGMAGIRCTSSSSCWRPRSSCGAGMCGRSRPRAVRRRHLIHHRRPCGGRGPISTHCHGA